MTINQITKTLRDNGINRNQSFRSNPRGGLRTDSTTGGYELWKAPSGKRWELTIVANTNNRGAYVDPQITAALAFNAIKHLSNDNLKIDRYGSTIYIAAQ